MIQIHMWPGFWNPPRELVVDYSCEMLTKFIPLFAPLLSGLRSYKGFYKYPWPLICFQVPRKSPCVRCFVIKAQKAKASFDGEQEWLGPSRNMQRSLESYIAGTFFPVSLEEAVRQASDAVLIASKDNYNRLRVELQYPTLSNAANVIEYSELAYFCNMICETFLGQSKRVHLFSDTNHILNLVPLLDTRLINSISVSCIDDLQPYGRPMMEDICLILLPSNVGYDMGRRMERIERLIYSISRNQHIILFNASMEACTTLTCGGRPFEPMILSDFHTVYFVHPNISRKGCFQSSLLRCYPRDWELFVLKLPLDMSSKYFLARSFTSRPSIDRIEIETSCCFHSL